MPDPLLEHPRALAEKVARVLGGRTVNRADLAGSTAVQGEIAEVRSAADLEAWHSVYCEVFGANPRSRIEWRRVHGAIAPSGDGSLLLLLARVGGTPAATGAHASSTVYR